MLAFLETSTIQESQVLNEVGDLFPSKAHEKLTQYLQEGGETLLQKVLNFVEYGVNEQAAEEDLCKPLHRNVRTFSQLSLETLKIVFQSFHGTPDWGPLNVTNSSQLFFFDQFFVF